MIYTPAPRTVIPGTVAGGSILLHPGVQPYTVRPRTVGGPDWDAQRFYFRSTTPAEVSPDFDGAWTNTTNALRRYLAPEPLAADTITGSGFLTMTAGQVHLARQFVGPMMRAGVVLTAAMISCWMRALQSDADDNLTTRFGLRACSADGAIIRATLLDVDHYGTGTELGGNRQFANDEPAVGDYVTQSGDRFVAEIGCADAAGTTPSSAYSIGSSPANDMAENEGASTLDRPWLEISPAA